MIAKIHQSNDRALLALCDNDLLGKCFEENDLQLDLSGNFYKGEEKNEEEVLELIAKVNIVNAIGKECIEFLMKHKMITNENIIKIKDIPHVQLVFS